MTQEEINASLDKMLENPKSKTFLNHLVRAYMPVTNVVKVMQKPKGDFKCVLTRTPLVSASEIRAAIEDEKTQAFFFEKLDAAFDTSSDKTTELEKLIGDRKLAVTGKDTTTFMTYPAFQGFYNWVITKSLNGDKHINWLLGGIRRTSFMNRAETIGDPTVQNKVEKFKNHGKPKTASYTISDSSDVLSKLKAQMESQGK